MNKRAGATGGFVHSNLSKAQEVKTVFQTCHAELSAQVLAQAYHYDQLNRLKQARGVTGLTGVNTWASVTDAVPDRYKSDYEFDANGNILAAQRYNDAGLRYDSLTYHYEKNGAQLLRNRLYHLNESTDGGYGDIGVDGSTYHGHHEDVNLLNNYQYDALGNLIQDKREEIGNIEWTVAGKVKHITRTAGSTKPELWFTYGADGQRTSKTVGDPANGGYREHYIRDAQGNIMATYRYTVIPVPNTTPQQYTASLKVTDRPIYGSKRIGSYTRQLELVGEPAVHAYPYVQPMQAPLKRYELTDHLGNVAAVVSGRLLPGNGAGSPYQAELMSAQGYEAFGSLLPGRNYSSDSYRFGFQGQIKDDQIYGATGTSYAFEYRMHDPRVGRFWSVDPLAAKYPWNSPYAFSENRVIDSNELEGLESIPGGQIVTSDDLLAPSMLTTATDATVTPLTLWDSQVRYPQGGPATKSGLLTEVVIGGAVFSESLIRGAVSDLLLAGSTVVAGTETFVRNARADIANDFSENRQYPRENVTAPYTLRDNWSPVRRDDLMSEKLTPTQGAEVVGVTLGIIGFKFGGFLPNLGKGTLVNEAAEEGIKTGVTEIVKSGLEGLDQKDKDR